MKSSQDLFVGIDPGKSGALVVLNSQGELMEIHVTPLIGKEYDKHKMAQILSGLQKFITHVALEDVHAIQGPAGNSSNFEFGRGKGLWEMALCALHIPHTMIQAKEWQKHAWEGVPKQTLPTKRISKTGAAVEKVDTKATSLIAAKRLFPHVKLTATERSSVPHDGIVDALLIAEVCRRKFK